MYNYDSAPIINILWHCGVVVEDISQLPRHKIDGPSQRPSVRILLCSRQLLRWHIPPEARYQSSSSSFSSAYEKNPLLRVSPDPDLSINDGSELRFCLFVLDSGVVMEGVHSGPSCCHACVCYDHHKQKA